MEEGKKEEEEEESARARRRRRNEIHFSPITESLFYRKQSSSVHERAALRCATFAPNIARKPAFYYHWTSLVTRPAGLTRSPFKSRPIWSGMESPPCEFRKFLPVPFRSVPVSKSYLDIPVRARARERACEARTHLINRRIRH